MSDLRDLPESTLVYIPGYGETTIGEIRAKQKTAADLENERDKRYWEDLVTRNLTFDVRGRRARPTRLSRP